jgi:hypothetical protein
MFNFDVSEVLQVDWLMFETLNKYASFYYEWSLAMIINNTFKNVLINVFFPLKNEKKWRKIFRVAEQSASKINSTIVE